MDDKMKLWLKILLSVLVGTVLLCGGFISLLMISFVFGGNNLLNVFALLWVVLILATALVLIWSGTRFRWYLKAVSVVMAVSVVISAGMAAYRAYHNSIDELGNSEVKLHVYEPFAEGTKAASLEEESTLKISTDIPVIDGATALYPLYSAFARAVYAKEEFDRVVYGEKDYESSWELVTCSNTEWAYKRLIDGEVDIIFAAGPSEKQLASAEAAGAELNMTPIGREAFVFFVNAKNPVDALTTGNIRDIYSGTITDWSELGGKSKKIRAFQRPENSGSQTALERLMGDVPLVDAPISDVADGMGGMIRSVSAYKNYDNAIGYSFLYYTTDMVADNKIKLLSLDGIAPTRENVANGTYPHSSQFYAVTAGSDNPNIDAFIEWILSEQGQYLVEKTGYTRLK